MNFEKYLGKLFCRTPLNNQFSHDAVFSFMQISEVCSLKSIYLVGQLQISRRNSQARSILCSYENQVGTSLSRCGHTCTHLGILIAGELEEEEELKNLLMLGKYMKNKNKIILINKNLKIVNGTFWSRSLIFLIHCLE